MKHMRRAAQCPGAALLLVSASILAAGAEQLESACVARQSAQSAALLQIRVSQPINESLVAEDSFVTEDSFVVGDYFVESLLDPGQLAVVIHKFHNRLGNNIYEIAGAITLAEALGAQQVTFPENQLPKPAIFDMFDLPVALQIEPNLALQSRTACKDNLSSGVNIFGPNCAGLTNDDKRVALLKYLKPLLNNQTAAACREAERHPAQLAIHLRSGDLLMTKWPLSERQVATCNLNAQECNMAPCAFLDFVINRFFSFSNILVVTEPDMAHPCLGVLKERHPTKNVTIQSTTIQEDACQLLSADHIMLGSPSTFSTSMILLNEQVRDVFAPWTIASTSCNKSLPGDLRTLYFQIDGMEKGHLRVGDERLAFMLNTSTEAVSAHVECNGFQWR